MIDITTALYNILHSRYGRDVRQSIHDAVYQIDANANEALANAKTMGVGTAVNSATSSSTGYVTGNLYLNSSTWDLWKCIGTNSWLNTGNIKGAQGQRGNDGTSNYIFIRYSQYYDGTDFTASPTASSQFMGVYYGSSATAPTNKQDYQWASYVGAAGTSAYVHIMYSEQADGTNFVSVPTALTKYVGFYAGTSSSAPANKSYYTWSKYVGADGQGSGNMTKAEYAGSGIVGAVDNALNLKKSDGTTVSADSVTQKLSVIDNTTNKVKLGSIANGTTPNDVLTWNGTTWQSKASQGGISPNDMLGFDTTQGETVDDGIDKVINNTAHNKVVDALVVKNFANTYKERITVTTTTRGITIGDWEDTTTYADWITDSSLIIADNDEDVELQFMYEVDGNVPIYLGGYKWENTLGKLCVKFGTEVEVGTKIAIDIIHTRRE